MKFRDNPAIIDIGSNSVRLMLCRDTGVEKLVWTTKLAEGSFKSGVLSESAMTRTIDAISHFIERAKHENACAISLFATEAVRSAKNGLCFCTRVYQQCGFVVDILTAEQEARCGFIGATAAFSANTSTATLDIGGASSELVVGNDKTILYSHSLPLGIVRLFDACGRNRADLQTLLLKHITEYEVVPPFDRLFAIGGTSTTLAAYDLNLAVYNPSLVHGHLLSRDRLAEITNTLFSLTVEETRQLSGIPEKRAETIACGALLLLNILDYTKQTQFTVSESDNLEGYYLMKQENI